MGDRYDLLIGSSNLTATALSTNKELNLHVSGSENGLFCLFLLTLASYFYWNSENLIIMKLKLPLIFPFMYMKTLVIEKEGKKIFLKPTGHLFIQQVV